MRIALIGLGHVARFQLEALQQVEEAVLVAAHDIDPERAGILPVPVPFFSQLDDLLEQGEADIIMVSTPNNTHYDLGRRVLESGFALLLEKPCCSTNDQLDKLVRRATHADLFFAVAFHAAYARDLLWYLGQLDSGEFEFGPLTGFHAGFYDPYCRDGHIVSAARGLGGSWFDSGINALSVIGRLIEPANLQLIEGRMTVIDRLDCSEVQGSATFKYAHQSCTGQGVIDTNWTLGLDQKITRLYYGLTNTEVTLHHSDETVSIMCNEEAVLVKNLRGELPRLTNHYVNLFRDIAHRFLNGADNIGHAAALHRLLFAAGSGAQK